MNGKRVPETNNEKLVYEMFRFGRKHFNTYHVCIATRTHAHGCVFRECLKDSENHDRKIIQMRTRKTKCLILN